MMLPIYLFPTGADLSRSRTPIPSKGLCGIFTELDAAGFLDFAVFAAEPSISRL